jgi:hypothetical protein
LEPTVTTTNRLALALVSLATAGAVAAGVVMLATVGAPSAGAPASTKINSPNALGAEIDNSSAGRPATIEPVSHGGGKVSVPASWPSAVPLPVATITAKSTRPRVWLLMLNAHGTMSQVRAKVISLYKAHGFVNKPQSTTLIVLQNRKYRVTALLANHDHRATSTDMRLELDARTLATARA